MAYGPGLRPNMRQHTYASGAGLGSLETNTDVGVCRRQCWFRYLRRYLPLPSVGFLRNSGDSP